MAISRAATASAGSTASQQYGSILPKYRRLPLFIRPSAHISPLQYATIS